MKFNGLTVIKRVSSPILRTVFILSSFLFFAVSLAFAQETIEVGETGFGVKRPVLASACDEGCPWGELGDFVKEAMNPFGYEVILCRNCNRDLGPRIVSNASYPPEISEEDLVVGTTQRVNAKVDFGITESCFLSWAYRGLGIYADEGPYSNLRLIAKIEDPTYLLVAARVELGITSLAEIVENQMSVRILEGGSPHSQAVLDYYGLTKQSIESWGGSFANAMVVGMEEGADAEFDVIISELASPANNPESYYWTAFTQRHDLIFLDLPEELLDDMAGNDQLCFTRVVAKWGFLRGVDRPIPIVARSGEAVFAREDTPEQAAYDVAKAIDEHRSALRWYIRPYSYDSRTVWQNFGVPLHPGAKRYYREMGYISTERKEEDECGWSVDRYWAIAFGSLVVILAMILVFIWQRASR
jgi:TRAP transporter TAXI family solute receptor